MSHRVWPMPKKHAGAKRPKPKKQKGPKPIKKKIDYPIPRLGQQAAKAYTNGQNPKRYLGPLTNK